MMVGSRRESAADTPPELPGFPADMKVLIAACRLISSWSSRFCFRLTKKNAAPAIAAIAITPTTTPAAMAALFGPDDWLDEALLLLCDAAVAVTVLPPMVTTEATEDVVAVADEL